MSILAIFLIAWLAVGAFAGVFFYSLCKVSAESEGRVASMDQKAKEETGGE